MRSALYQVPFVIIRYRHHGHFYLFYYTPTYRKADAYHDRFALKRANGLAQIEISSMRLFLVAERNVPAVVVRKNAVEERRTSVTTEQRLHLLLVSTVPSARDHTTPQRHATTMPN